jgi:hypothetical protein
LLLRLKMIWTYISYRANSAGEAWQKLWTQEDIGKLTFPERPFEDRTSQIVKLFDA